MPGDAVPGMREDGHGLPPVCWPGGLQGPGGLPTVRFCGGGLICRIGGRADPVEVTKSADNHASRSPAAASNGDQVVAAWSNWCDKCNE
jgi:hypothetical protein